MARKTEEGLPVAVATQGGLLATLAVLLIGTMIGTRAWILLIKAGIAFLLVSGILKLLTAGILQAIRWKDDVPEEKTRDSEEVDETARTITSAAQSPETVEKVAS